MVTYTIGNNEKYDLLSYTEHEIRKVLSFGFDNSIGAFVNLLSRFRFIFG